jgi:integrase
MGWQHVRNDFIAVKQQKTGTELSVPLHPELRTTLAKAPEANLMFLLTAKGAPFTAAGFGNWFREVVSAAGLSDECSAHGLRKAAARRLAEAGCTPHEIMAITGHKTLKEVERYTREASQARLGAAAMARIPSGSDDRS